MTTPVSASRQQTPPDAAKRLGETATVVAFVPPKRRGRPRKPPVVDHRCTDDFDTVAMAVAGIARQKMLWNAAKERVRDDADRNNGLAPTSRRLLGFLVSHVNRQRGYDWHPAATMAADLGISVSSVERGYGELTLAGLILRRREAVRGGPRSVAWKWQTTLPALVQAARDVVQEREARARSRLGMQAPKSPDGKDEEPCKKSGRAPQENGKEPSKNVAIEPLKNPLEESVGGADDDLEHHPIEPAVEPAASKRALQEEVAAGASSRTKGATGDSGPKTAIEVPSLRPSPRYDTTLPMEQRLVIPAGGFGTPRDPDDAALLRKLQRACRGWDLRAMHTAYCARMDSATTRDAVEGFCGWAWKYRPTAAPNWREADQPRSRRGQPVSIG